MAVSRWIVVLCCLAVPLMAGLIENIEDIRADGVEIEHFSDHEAEAVSLENVERSADKVLEIGISALIFDARKMTKGRRAHPRPQLQCVGGSARGFWWRYPKYVTCQNVGNDGVHVTWKCEADLHDNLHFGATNVVCEGYEDAEDEYVVAGSCGLEYTLFFETFTVTWVHGTMISVLTFLSIVSFVLVRYLVRYIIPDKQGAYIAID